MSTLLVTVGISGCGKTTWANQTLHRKISSDECRIQFTGDINNMSRNKEVFEYIDRKITEHSKNSIYNLIYDATNCNLEFLKKFEEKHKDEFDEIEFLLFPCSPELAYKRILERKNGAKTPKKVIEKMAKGFEEVKDYLLENKKSVVIITLADNRE